MAHKDEALAAPLSSSSPISSSSPSTRFSPRLNACHCLNVQLSLLPVSQPQYQQHVLREIQEHVERHRHSPLLNTQTLTGQLESKEIQHAALTAVKPFSVPSSNNGTGAASTTAARTQISFIQFRCLNCKMNVFAIEDSVHPLPLCILNLQTIQDKQIQTVKETDTYSHVFNLLILPPSFSSSAAPIVSDSAPLSARRRHSVLSLRSVLDRAIENEHLAMKMRINEVVMKENAKLQKYEEKAKKELHVLTTLLLAEEAQQQHSANTATTNDTAMATRATSTSSRSSSPSSPRAAISPTSSSSSSPFVPIPVLLRRPSRSSPRFQRLVLDGIQHSLTSPASSIATEKDEENSRDEIEEDLSSHQHVLQEDLEVGLTGPTLSPTRSRLHNLSSSLPRSAGTITGHRAASPRQSVLLPTPQLNMPRKRSIEQGLTRDDDGEEEEKEMKHSEQLIGIWRAEDEAQLADYDRLRRKEVGRTTTARHSHAKRAAVVSDAQHPPGDADDVTADSNAIFQLDEDESDDDEPVENEIPVAETIPSQTAATSVLQTATADDGDDKVVDQVNQSNMSGLGSTTEEEEDAALSDEELVAQTSTADIQDMVRRSSIPIITAHMPINKPAQQQSEEQYAAVVMQMVPSSLPIPIPAPLRQLTQKKERQSSITHITSTSSSTDSKGQTAAAAASIFPAKSSSPLLLPADTAEIDRKAQRELDAETEEEKVDPSAGHDHSIHSPDDEERAPFIPPHTMVQEPYFSFAKAKHLHSPKKHHIPPVLSSSLPVHQPFQTSVGTVGYTTVFRKEDLTKSFGLDGSFALSRPRGPSSLSKQLAGVRSQSGSVVVNSSLATSVTQRS